MNPDWEESVDLSLHCIARGWAYAAVVLVPIASIIGCIAVLVICCCCWLKTTSKRTVETDSSETETPSNLATNTRTFSSNLESGLPAAEPQDDANPDPLDGAQDLTAIPPPTYGASLAYPSPTVNPPQIDDNLSAPPPYPQYKSTSV